RRRRPSPRSRRDAGRPQPGLPPRPARPGAGAGQHAAAGAGRYGVPGLAVGALGYHAGAAPRRRGHGLQRGGAGSAAAGRRSVCHKLLVGRLDAVAGAGADRRALAGAALRHPPALRHAVSDAADLAIPTSPVAPAVSAWEDPPRGDQTDGAPVLSIDGFAGPLDWLLEMA